MSRAGLNTLNCVLIVMGLALACTSMWYFVQVDQFIRLRNTLHYLLDYKVYLPQAAPWIFFMSSVFLISVAIMGLVGASKKNVNILRLYTIFMGLTVTFMFAVSILCFVFADNEITSNFIKETVYDIFSEVKNNPDALEGFGNIERKLQCCGANDARDYRNWRNVLPQSCCDRYYLGFFSTPTQDCDLANRQANDRLGCMSVATVYARVITYALAGANLFVALVAIMAIVISVTNVKTIKRRRPKVVSAQDEIESKKILYQ